MTYLLPSLRLWLASLLVCVIVYTALMLVLAQAVVPAKAGGSLIERDGLIIGSELIAQDFTSDGYFWPRPSAIDYDGMGAGGSNLSPTSADLTQRAEELIARHGAAPANPLPADLAAASGGGLDPHISLEAAMFQAERVAAARGLGADAVRAIIEREAYAPGGLLAKAPIVNVLALNLALDGLGG
jgi:potassium-transporting ATPase KdpC subunit